jgi:hypothetical protein
LFAVKKKDLHLCLYSEVSASFVNPIKNMSPAVAYNLIMKYTATHTYMKRVETLNMKFISEEITSNEIITRSEDGQPQ